MSNTYTPNVGLAKPALGDRTWNVPLNGNCDDLDALSPVGGLNVTTKEQPSSSLKVNVAAGSFVLQSGAVGTYGGTVGQALSPSATSVLYLDGTASWALTVAGSYPATPHVCLATVVTGANAVTSVTDNRVCFPAAGSIADGVNLTLGTTTGTQIATAANQRLGFFGATPAVQPTLGTATAAGTYGANEQGMLQRVYNAVRALGLGN